MKKSIAFSVFLAAVALTFALCCMAGEKKSGADKSKPKDKPLTLPAGEEFSAQTEDKITVYGSLYLQPTAPEKAPLIIAFHQMSKDRHEYEASGIAQALYGEGYNLILMDDRGHGKSTATENAPLDWKNMGKADWEKAGFDVAAAIKFAESRKLTGAGIGLIGASIGSTTVLLYAAMGDSKVKFVIMLSPGLAWRDVDTKEPMKKAAGVPVLLVASDKDADGYCAQTADELSKLNPKSEKKIYPGGKHGVYMTTDAPVMIGDIIAFVKKNLSAK